MNVSAGNNMWFGYKFGDNIDISMQIPLGVLLFNETSSMR